MSRELVYELRERIYQNQYKIFSPVNKPSTNNYGSSLPILITNDENVTMKDFYSKKALDYYFKMNNEWAHVSRASDIISRAAPKHLTERLFRNNFHVCPASSKRNLGRQGMFINSAIEFGLFYHRLVPKSTKKWSKFHLSHQMIAEAKVKGTL